MTTSSRANNTKWHDLGNGIEANSEPIGPVTQAIVDHFKSSGVHAGTIFTPNSMLSKNRNGVLEVKLNVALMRGDEWAILVGGLPFVPHGGMEELCTIFAPIIPGQGDVRPMDTNPATQAELEVSHTDDAITASLASMSGQYSAEDTGAVPGEMCLANAAGGHAEVAISFVHLPTARRFSALLTADPIGRA